MSLGQKPTSSRKRRKVMRAVEKFEARQFREVGMSVKDCAAYFNVSLATLMRGLAEMREKFGPEKLPRKIRRLARCTVENSRASAGSTSST